MTATGNNYFLDQFRINDIWLAPMAGVSDAPFRRICAEYGAHLMTSEMISAKGLIYKNPNSLSLMKLNENEKASGIQIFGSDTEALREAVIEYVNPTKFSFIDINMGCPVKKVVSNGDGCALMGNLNKLFEVAKAIVDAAQLPVSAKIRLGLDSDNISCVDAAKLIEDAGVSCVIVHGRTRDQFYSGSADLDEIAKVVEAVNIPVIGNGDVVDYDSYKKMKAHTKCAGVMIGRAAMGNPFIFSQIANCKETGIWTQPSLQEKVNVMRKHFTYLLAHTNEFYSDSELKACQEFRSHISWYTKGMKGGSVIRSRSSKINTAEEFFQLFDEMIVGTILVLRN